MNFHELAKSRRSIRDYDSSEPIDDKTLAEIFSDVILTPSSFNLQPWRFVVVRDKEQKRRLRAVAMDQAQVENSSAVIVVCGKLDAYKDAEAIYKDASPEVRDRVVAMAAQFYSNPAVAKDEAIRGASMAAMTLMYAAKDRGLDTGPMGGFDPDGVAKVLGLPENLIPVIMVVIGKGKPPPFPRGYRLPVNEVVYLEGYGDRRLRGPES